MKIEIASKQNDPNKVKGDLLEVLSKAMFPLSVENQLKVYG